MILTFCPSCGQHSGKQFIGIQEDENDQPLCSLWNCMTCGTTLAGYTATRDHELEEWLLAHAGEEIVQDLKWAVLDKVKEAMVQ